MGGSDSHIPPLATPLVNAYINKSNNHLLCGAYGINHTKSAIVNCDYCQQMMSQRTIVSIHLSVNIFIRSFCFYALLSGTDHHSGVKLSENTMFL